MNNEWLGNALGYTLKICHSADELETICRDTEAGTDWERIYELAQAIQYEAEALRDLAYGEIQRDE